MSNMDIKGFLTDVLHGSPRWFKVLVLLVVVVLCLISALFFQSCASTHAVTQSFLKQGDTLTLIRYEQIGTVRK